jgi:hypothetical protein
MELPDLIRIARALVAGLTVMLVVCAVAAVRGEPAAADPPGTGYSFDSYWGCGVIPAGGDCWDHGTFNFNNAVNHTTGWAYTIYQGTGDTFVCVEIYSPGPHNFDDSTCNTDEAAVCYRSTCNDQDGNPDIRTTMFPAYHNHTLAGHLKA